MKKNKTIEKVMLIFSCLLYVLSIVPISKEIIVFGIILSAFLLALLIPLQIKDKTKVKFISILISGCSLITNVVFLMYILYMI